MLQYQSLTLEHAPLVKEYLDRYPRESCDYSLANLFTWGKIYNNQFCVHEDKLIIVNPLYQYVCFPLGEEISPEFLADIVIQSRATFPDAELILVPEDYLLTHPGLHRYFEVEDNRSWADYIHSIDRLVELKGKKLAKKKNLISQFIRTYPDYHVLPIYPSHKEEILQFTRDWRKERDVEGIFLNSEYTAIQNSFDMWEELPMTGLIICHEHHVYAYSIFSPLTTDMVAEHYEKFDPDKKGSAQIINWETARYLKANGYSWLNREQDLGLEGLRHAKLSYDPDYLVKFITTELRPEAADLLQRL